MPAQLPDVLARVNGEPVKKSDFDRLILNIEVSNGPIPPDRRDGILRNMLDQLITYTAMSQQAKNGEHRCVGGRDRGPDQADAERRQRR